MTLALRASTTGSLWVLSFGLSIWACAPRSLSPLEALPAAWFDDLSPKVASPPPVPFTPEVEIHNAVGMRVRAGRVTRTMVGFVPVEHRPWRNIVYWILNERGDRETLTVACGRWATKRWFGMIEYALVHDQPNGQAYWQETNRRYAAPTLGVNPWTTEEERRERLEGFGMENSLWPSACRWMPKTIFINTDERRALTQMVNRNVRPPNTFAKRGPIDAMVVDRHRFAWEPDDRFKPKVVGLMQLSLPWAFVSYGSKPIVPLTGRGGCHSGLYFAPRGEDPVECATFSAQYPAEWSTLRFIDASDYPSPIAEEP